MKTNAGSIVAALSMTCMLGSPLLAAETTANLQDGFELDWGDNRQISLGGRVHFDVAQFSDDVTPIDDESDFRRARAILRGRHGDWLLRADYDVGIATGWRNLNVEYSGLRRQRITVGQQVAPFSLDDLGGSNDLAFLERSLASALSPGMLIGASWRRWGDNWTLTAGVFGDELNDQDRREADGTSVIGRVTYTPIRTSRQVLHIGVAQEFRSSEDGSEVRLRSRPESRLADARLVDTGRIVDAGDLSTTGLELLGLYNNIRFQAEYMRASLDGGLDSPTFSGAYVQASVVLTGERYRYSRARGVPTGIRPQHRLGALEASMRYSTLDLFDGSVSGGQQRQLSAALSWYINRQLRINLNYSLYDADPNALGIEEDGSILMLRLQAAI